MTDCCFREGWWSLTTYPRLRWNPTRRVGNSDVVTPDAGGQNGEPSVTNTIADKPFAAKVVLVIAQARLGTDGPGSGRTGSPRDGRVSPELKGFVDLITRFHVEVNPIPKPSTRERSTVNSNPQIWLRVGFHPKTTSHISGP